MDGHPTSRQTFKAAKHIGSKAHGMESLALPRVWLPPACSGAHPVPLASLRHIQELKLSTQGPALSVPTCASSAVPGLMAAPALLRQPLSCSWSKRCSYLPGWPQAAQIIS